MKKEWGQIGEKIKSRTGQELSAEFEKTNQKRREEKNKQFEAGKVKGLHFGHFA